MKSLLFLAESSPQWFQELLDSHVLPFVVAIIAITSGMTVAAMKAVFRHRERMAKIEHGIDPDAKEPPK